MSEYAHVRAGLDPLGTIHIDDGSRRLQIELVLSDDPDRDPPRLADPVCALNSSRARELAFALLQLAEHADREGRRR
jgi:hypothetical protein